VVQDGNGTWHVFMTTADTSGDWSLAYTSFTDWSQAADAPHTSLETASADDMGHLYRAETTVAEFPGGFGEAQLVLENANANNLFEGEAVYRVGDSNTYLLIMEAIGSDGRRWYRSFTAEGLTGEWLPLADTEDHPFARSNNVSFDDGNAWTQDISHGELIRTTNDQTMTIDPCNLQLLYQGMDPSTSGDYSQWPWRIALATHTNPTC
jgi:hypothetical protein